MTFDMLIDLEEGRDFVSIAYGDRQRVELSGIKRRKFDRLQLPVTVSFRSNSFIRSNDVILQNIKVFKSALPNP